MNLYETGDRVELFDTHRQAWMPGDVTGANPWTVLVALDDRMISETADPGDLDGNLSDYDRGCRDAYLDTATVQQRYVDELQGSDCGDEDGMS